jgi:hypothetical protein
MGTRQATSFGSAGPAGRWRSGAIASLPVIGSIELVHDGEVVARTLDSGGTDRATLSERIRVSHSKGRHPVEDGEGRTGLRECGQPLGEGRGRPGVGILLRGDSGEVGGHPVTGENGGQFALGTPCRRADEGGRLADCTADLAGVATDRPAVVLEDRVQPGK